MEEAMKRDNWFMRVRPNLSDFKQEIWKGVSGSKKVEYAWNMVVEAMHIKKTPEKLRFQKVIIKSQKSHTKYLASEAKIVCV
ncbi:MAG: hypothetical protein AB1297_06165 [bacterium]